LTSNWVLDHQGDGTEIDMLEEQVILIAGASGGLGEGIVGVMARTAARLALVSRRQDALETMARDAGLTDERVLCLAADLTRPDEATRVAQAVLGRWGRIDALLNSVGTWKGGVKVGDVTDEQWHDLMATNLHSAFYLTRAVLPAMVEREYGRIVHVGARAAELPGTDSVVYNVTKAGLAALARSVARDYGAIGIRANVIHPGTIGTRRRRERSGPDVDRSTWVWPDHIAQVMLLLCGEAGADINGAAIPVYGP
jgi:NAD(P)-dependent dehydrogenase (short-subunit alcohol dehydrogenase family)